MSRHRFAVVGGGIIGTSVARRLGQLRPDASVTLLEKESELGLSTVDTERISTRG